MNLIGFDFELLAREKKMAPLHLAREFVQLEILRRVSASALRRLICFKGGTALHLVFNMERYSEDLDFSVVSTVPANEIVALVRDILKGEEVIDCKVKRKTVLAEMRQQFRPQNFRVKLEINTDNIVPAELKTLYSEYVPASFDLQIMRTDYLIAQKVRALLQRKKGRDLHDLWFVLRTKLPVDISIVSEMAGIPKSEVLLKLEEKIAALDERQIAADIRPFVRPSLRPWVKDGLKRDVLQLLRSVSAANY